ncbi:DNA gyrase subunit A [Holospora curviuscula]|uniref:DNA topoisomerase (ATP-hydrolyzing) n=1 Tax=Holospora curviuscula TaxID=1082868 RepID=A0A2S5RA58_9PROT|nr:DNA gyrase subunit A [Holospora curviuscula]PPE04183.1 DNA gyrase subunit A [Holospora curviuscula]
MDKSNTKALEVVSVPVEEEIRRSYLDYAMSVIVSRALPDVRDGLKPVHRRILYAMETLGFRHDRPHRKSANVVGEVIAKYHPHGTDPIYGSLVRMAQWFSMREKLVDGHGNFGSMDGDRAAAMRYTEARLSALSDYMLADYDKETVDFQPNYDDTQKMPVVLPAAFPNLLVNGGSGIAVGMATNIPCHNLAEVLDACCLLLDHKDAELEHIMTVLPGPDFPTKGIILGTKGIGEAYRTGRGSFLIRGQAQVEAYGKDRECILITEIPYQVNKSALVERIAEVARDKKIEGMTEVRDESDRMGVRIVIELKKDAAAQVILNQLYILTDLQVSFSVNMLALHRGYPVQLSLLEVLRAFLEFRREVVVRRTQYYLRKDRETIRILIGIYIAISHIDRIVELIKASRDRDAALQALITQIWQLDSIVYAYLSLLDNDIENLEAYNVSGYRLSQEQASAILALRLHRLTGIGKQELSGQLETLKNNIQSYLELLRDDHKIDALMKEEFLHIKEKFGSPRLTKLQGEYLHQSPEDFVACEDMVVTVSVNGYIKRVPLDAYRSQKRGGRGKSAMDVREEDAVSQIFVADTHRPLLFFTSKGIAYQMKVHELPLGTTTARGKPLIAFFPLERDIEKVATILPLPKDNVPYFIIFATSHGNVRKNALLDFLTIRANGKIAMKLEDGEQLIRVLLANDDQDILLSTHQGKSLRFPVQELRKFTGRNSTGVRGISLKPEDYVISMTLLNNMPWTSQEIELYMSSKAPLEEKFISSMGENNTTPILDDQVQARFSAMEAGEEFVLCVTTKGCGKRTSSYEYRRAHRGGQGVASMEVTARTGSIIQAIPVKAQDQILMLTNTGQLLRCPVKDIRISRRKTQGVRVFRLAKGETVVSVAVISPDSLEVCEEDLQIT